MSFQIKSGLFQFDFTDQHAVLGVSIDADYNEIRKRYMQIARRLHGDSSPLEEGEKALAGEFLAKFVNVAYNKFSRETDRKEYSLLLDMVGKRLLQETNKIQLHSQTAKELEKAPNFPDAYKTAIEQLAAQQYESMYKVLEVTAAISELNMLYLLKKQKQTGSVSSNLNPSPKVPPAHPTSTPPHSSPGAVESHSSFAEQACRRAEVLINGKNYAKAILELKEALKVDPKHSKTHALLAQCYLGQGQATMAKLELKKALESNPKEPLALELQKKVDPASAKSSAQTGKSQKTSSGGGFFGGLFGGGKKK